MSTDLTYHPRHGTHDPTTSTPERHPHSIRRTTSIDMSRPEGPEGPLTLLGIARDLYTGTDGAGVVVNMAQLECTVAFHDNRRIVSLATSPRYAATEQFVGSRAGSGFRSLLDQALPDLLGTPLYQLLDDVPVATLISGFSLNHAGYVARSVRVPQQAADICSGWRTGGTIMVAINATGRAPAPTGPPAPDIDHGADPLAWHEMQPIPPHGMRRRRRLDLVAGDVFAIDSMFRDSHVNADGLETVVHEYQVTASVDPATLVFSDVESRPRVLPWLECPSAAASAGRLSGQTAPGARMRLNQEMVGIGTCTHLNDHLRMFGDLPTLVSELVEASDR